jgi:S1-C subfamily serine protease
LEEQRFQLMSSDETSLSLRVGRLSVAKAIVIGEVHNWTATQQNNQSISSVSLSFRLVDVETGTVLFGGQGQFPQPLVATPQAVATGITGAILTRLALQAGLIGSGRLGFETRIMEKSETANIIVTRVFPGFPAESAGLRTGDAIISCNGRSGWRTRKEFRRLCQVDAGQQLALEVWRGQETLTIRATAVNRF